MLQDLERSARQWGSGLNGNRLQGRWLLERIWSRGNSRPAEPAGTLLRIVGATLTILPAADPQVEREGLLPAEAMPGERDTLVLINSVRRLGLELRFSGPGRLQGRRPLLLFQFDRLRIRAGAWELLERRLPAAPPRRQPFFALIGMAEDASWLAARGRSGGLALWRRAEAPEGQPQRL